MAYLRSDAVLSSMSREFVSQCAAYYISVCLLRSYTCSRRRNFKKMN